MMDWLIDTLMWTAILIALVLLIRRPVAHYFGARAAYALWALPLLRLALPPLTLPAWLAPIESESVPSNIEPMLILTTTSERAVSVPVAAAEPVMPFSLLEAGLAVWIIGAAAFLALRFKAYFEMRNLMLADAREVGRVGNVRLVETPGTNAPLAFGVADKVIALPHGFLAAWDKDARDLALEHELSHHKGHDLLINFIAQPLFALHWFNPLGHLGWLALRRDQEAACDARVIDGRENEHRATYAKVIASFAAGPNVALAAPMACPVLGDKSIIHRLRSLKMNQQSRQRRLAGRGLIAAAIVALPLTATVTYADSSSFEEVLADVPAPPAPPVAVAPPAPPAPAVVPMAVQSAPEAPEGPEAPEYEVEENVWVEKDGSERHVIIRKEVEKDVVREVDGREVRKFRVVTVDDEGGALTEEQRREIMIEVREGLEEADVAIEEAFEAQRLAFKDLEDVEGEFTIVEVNCESGGKGQKLTKDGEELTVLCKSDIMASALEGLKQARKAIAENPEMPEDIMEEVIKALDEKIEKWESRS